MKIALLGYGRMGKAIEKIAIDRGHSISLKINENIENHNIGTADVAIDFSIPEAATNNISNCLKNGVPVISGTTGWLKEYDNMVALANEKNGAFIYASNFSLGVNIFFELNKQLAKMMSTLSQYKVDLEEIHHTKKLDAPSGTAISLAEGIIQNSNYNDWKLDNVTDKSIVPIKAKRIEDISGTHHVNYNSNVDAITISHTAHNREGFALGAVIAAEWIIDKTGVFTMNDVLNIG